MSLQSAYKQFLAAPNSSLLASDATLHYITTTTSYKGATEIIKHLATVRNQIKKKKEDVLNVIEAQTAAAIEVEMSFEFITGGPYLPEMDDNFLADRVVSLPMIHMVTFDDNGKILQIRQSWDQGSLLKQVEVTGRTGRNWPIRDGKDQLKMIAACIKSTDASVAAPAATGDSSSTSRSRGNSNNIPRDPHASLALFVPRGEIKQDAAASVISPRGGARPRQRDFTEILGDEPPEEERGRGRSVAPKAASVVRPKQRDFTEILGDEPTEEQMARDQSPSKVIAPKIGAGKNFQPSRLFETDAVAEMPSPDDEQPSDRFYRPHPKKFNHFDFADGSDPQDAPKPGDVEIKQTKHSSQWSFDDFVTPHKAKPTKVLQKSHQDVRHWGTEDDDVQETPIRRPVVPKPRRDAETHFDFVDDGPNAEPRVARPRGNTHNEGLGLYENNIVSEEGAENGTVGQAPLGNITNLKDRGREFAPHWDMRDDSPLQDALPKPTVAEDRKKVVKMMESSWDTYDKSPAQKENKPAKPTNKGERGIHIGGDGMGGSKGTQRNWLFMDEEEPKPKSVPGRKQGAGAKSGGFNWDF